MHRSLMNTSTRPPPTAHGPDGPVPSSGAAAAKAWSQTCEARAARVLKHLQGLEVKFSKRDFCDSIGFSMPECCRPRGPCTVPRRPINQSMSWIAAAVEGFRVLQYRPGQDPHSPRSPAPTTVRTSPDHGPQELGPDRIAIDVLSISGTAQFHQPKIRAVQSPCAGSDTTSPIAHSLSCTLQTSPLRSPVPQTRSEPHEQS